MSKPVKAKYFKHRGQVIVKPKLLLEAQRYFALSLAARVLMDHLQLAWNPGVSAVHYSARRAADVLGMSRGSAAAALRELVELGFMTITGESNWQNGKAREYRLNWIPSTDKLYPSEEWLYPLPRPVDAAPKEKKRSAQRTVETAETPVFAGSAENHTSSPLDGLKENRPAHWTVQGNTDFPEISSEAQGMPKINDLRKSTEIGPSSPLDTINTMRSACDSPPVPPRPSSETAQPQGEKRRSVDFGPTKQQKTPTKPTDASRFFDRGLDPQAWRIWTDHLARIGVALNPVSVNVAAGRLRKLPAAEQLAIVRYAVADGMGKLPDGGRWTRACQAA